MLHWMEGTMKLRGEQEDIKRFFLEGLEPYDTTDEKKCVLDSSTKNSLHIELVGQPYIIGTKKGYITDKNICMNSKEGVCCVNIKHSNVFVVPGFQSSREIWLKISNDYNVDIRLFGIRSDLQICQKVIVSRNRRMVANIIEYEDWDWECPFPKMGG